MRRTLISVVLIFFHSNVAFGQARDSARVPELLLNDVKTVGVGIAHGLTGPVRWSGDTWLNLAEAGASVIVVSALDDSGRSLMLRNHTPALDDAAHVIKPLGAQASLVFIGVYYGTGLALGSSKMRTVSAEAAAATVVGAGIITPVLKNVFGRSRPRVGREAYTFDPFSGRASFPSGHTTQAFAVATVFASNYEQWWVRAGAYTIATSVGISRMYHGAHFVSDVAAGAMIGTAVGASIARHGPYKSKDAARHAMQVSPMWNEGGPGVAVQFRTVGW